MEHAFFTVLNMSVAGAFAVLLALLLRPLLRRGAKWTLLIVWGVVALRLTVPVFFESRLAPLPAASFAETDAEKSSSDAFAEGTPEASVSPESAAPAQTFRPVPTASATGGPEIGQTVTSAPVQTTRPSGTALPAPTGEPAKASAPAATEAPLIPAITDETPSSPAGSGSGFIRILFWVWLAGCGAMLCYSLVSYFLLKRKLASAVKLRDGVYESEYARSPFTLGILRPNIYIPFGLGEKRLGYVLGHEKTHLRFADQLWKALGFAVLSLHWFNPLVWLAYALFCRDLELACDERVIKRLSDAERAEYSQTLLDLSAKKHGFGPSPLAFGEGDAANRIKSVLNYKKPKAALIVLSVVLAAALAACSFTANSPKDENGGETDQTADASPSPTAGPGGTSEPTGTPEPAETPEPTAGPTMSEFDVDSLGYTLVTLPAGDGEGQISVYTGFEDDVSTGPEDFIVENGTIWVLNSAAPTRSVLCLYLDGSLERSYPIDPGYRPGQLVRLCVGREKLYVIDLAGYMYVLDRESGELETTVPLPVGEEFIGDGFAGSIVYMAEENGRLSFTVRTYTDTQTFFASYVYDPDNARVLPTNTGVSGESIGVHHTLHDTATEREYRFDLPAGWNLTELLGFLPDGSCYVSAIRDADFPPYPRAVFCFLPDGSLLYQSREIAPDEASGVSVLRHFRLDDSFGTRAMLYDRGGFRLVLLKMFEDPADSTSEIIVSGSRYKSGYYEFRSLGEKLLHGERVGNVDFSDLDQCVFFRLEEDALRAYSELTTVSRYHSATGELDTYFGYSGLIAEYPREVGEAANQKLIEYANGYLGWGLTGDENFVSQGLVGDNWFALTTVDETIQDIQVHCIFRYDGSEWREFPGNNGGLFLDYAASDYGASFPTYCITVINKDVALLGYSSKFLWNEETGWSHPYVYRTANGGRSWEKLDLLLPDRFINDVSGYQMIQPAFEGAHGVLPLVCYPDGNVVWFETFDYGASWTYHE